MEPLSRARAGVRRYAPKGATRPPCRCGSVVPMWEKGYAVGIWSGSRRIAGPNRSTRAAAEDDLARARRCEDRQAMLDFVCQLRQEHADAGLRAAEDDLARARGATEDDRIAADDTLTRDMLDHQQMQVDKEDQNRLNRKRASVARARWIKSMKFTKKLGEDVRAQGQGSVRMCVPELVSPWAPHSA